MQFSQIIRLSLVALRTNKARSFLTMLGVIIGVTSVILLISVGSGLQKYITNQVESIGSNLLIIMPGKLDLSKLGQGGGGFGVNFMASKLTVRDAENLQNNAKFIEKAMPAAALQGAVKYKEEKMYMEMIGATANLTGVFNVPLAMGDYFDEADDRSGRKVAIIGSDVAKDLFGGEDPLGKRIVINTYRFDVKGVLKNKGVAGNTEDHVIIPLTTAMRISNQDKVSVIYAKAISPDKVDAAISEAKSVLLERLKDDEFTILTQKEMLSAVSAILGTLTVALSGIAAISLVVGGVGIMNIMLVSVTERTREIGLRKALGATTRVILVQFLIEAVVLSVGGGLIGVLLGSSISLLLNQFIPAQVTFWAVLLAFVVSAVVGVVFGVMPARKAAKLNPIDALRYE